MCSTFYSIFVEQGFEPEAASGGGKDLRCKMMLASCSKLDQSDSEEIGLGKKFSDDDLDEDDFLGEFGVDGYPRGKRLAPVGANEEVNVLNSFTIRCSNVPSPSVRCSTQLLKSIHPPR